MRDQPAHPRPRRVRRLALAGGCLLASLLLAAPAVANETLQPGQTFATALEPGQSLQFPLDVPAGQPFRLRLVERGIDVDAAVVIGDQRWPLEDDDILRWGDLRVAVARGAADMRLELRAPRLGSPSGVITLTLESVDLGDAQTSRRFGLDLVATELAQRYADRQRSLDPTTARMAASLCEGRRQDGDERGYVRCVSLQERILARQEQRAQAIEALQRALPVWQKLGDRRGEANAWNNLGMHFYRKGDGRLAAQPLQRARSVLTGVEDPLLLAVVQNNLCLTSGLRISIREARECYDAVLRLSLASGDPQRIATAYNNLGGPYLQLGDTRQAAELFRQAVAQRERIGDRNGQADPLSNLALVEVAYGRLSTALRGFERAEAIYRAANDRVGQARVLQYRGYVQMKLGESALAVDLLDQALVLQRQANSSGAVAATLARLAEAQLANDQPEAARASVEEAVTIAQVDDDPALLTNSWLRASRIHRRSGDAPAALAAAQQAFTLSAKLEGLHDLARLDLAQAELLLGNSGRARELAQAALDSRRLTQLQDIEALTVLASAQRSLGRRSAAEATYRRAIAATEKAGSYIYDFELRAAFLASQRAAETGLLALLMGELDAQGRFVRAGEALSLSANFRARSLRSRLDAMPAADAVAATPAREQQLAQLAALALERWRLTDGDAGRQRRRELDTQIRAAEDALRASDPAPAGAGGSEPLQLSALQRALPEDASLVVYRLLPDAGYAWVLRRDGLHAARLAPQQTLIEAVQRVRNSLAGVTDPAAGQSADADLAQACDLLWQPIAAQVTTHRVFIVGDAALDGLPFAALRCGSATQRDYLVQRHELSQLPATWLLLREPAAALPADFRALLVGDPVYGRDDPRLPAPKPGANAGPVPGERSRLPGSGDEIRRVQARLGAAHSTVLDGPAASLATLQGSAMENFHILHFATHGTGDSSSASAAGLVLSLFDAQGQAVDGFLSARRIGASRVRAALVVLGACDTATGRTIDGEGTFGVAYAFLQAGARRVVATLWPVDDRFMPEIMDRFYQDPALAAARPAQALRSAQLALLQRYPQASPTLWAGVTVWGW